MEVPAVKCTAGKLCSTQQQSQGTPPIPVVRADNRYAIHSLPMDPAHGARPRTKSEPPSTSPSWPQVSQAGRVLPRRISPRRYCPGVLPVRIRLTGSFTVEGTPAAVMKQDNVQAPCGAR
ncbi:hypothetical protein NDU88_006236 [Pleurodeles waltl]|uniref:Uncharacterized protein n=1 Tax=Pleurodeles waltl TaxID=8319 RepID=A0AAV7VPX6_PLEWA|nr:hypothetical protein NDU88_006236 [Pleurodeles waltl]